jgi:hypothetical protein
MTHLKEDFLNYIKNSFNINIDNCSVLCLPNTRYNKLKKRNDKMPFVNDFGFYSTFSDISYINLDNNHFLFNYIRYGLSRQFFFNYSIQGNEFKDIILKKGDVLSFLDQQYSIIDSLLPFTNEKRILGLELLLTDDFTKKILDKSYDLEKILSKKEFMIFDDFSSFKKQYGMFSIISEMGFPKYFSNETIIDVLDKLGYKKDKLKYIFRTGSKKPYSDVDIFMISDINTHTQNLGWIDICNISIKDLKNLYNKFDYSLIDAFFSGNLIYGKTKNVEKIKKDFLTMPITKQAIDYNFNKSIERKNDLLKNNSSNAVNYVARLENMKNYLTNAKELEKGIVHLTYQELRKNWCKYF